MKEFPGGTWIVLEGRAVNEQQDLVCIGYKYNSKNVLTFVMTKGAGSTSPGKPYQAKFPDMFGNVCVREVEQPDIISNYFGFSNCIDVHNQLRHSVMALEIVQWL